MTTGQVLTLILMGLIFAVWVFLLFRTLFMLNKIAASRRRERRVGYFQGIGITVEIFGEFALANEHRVERNRLVLVTVLMFVFQLVQFWILVPE